MRKNARKMESHIVKALNSVCETLRFQVVGFCWLTHFVDYDDFPRSFKLICVFATNQALKSAKENALASDVLLLATDCLENEGVSVEGIGRSVFFDTVENGADVDDPNWCRKYR